MTRLWRAAACSLSWCLKSSVGGASSPRPAGAVVVRLGEQAATSAGRARRSHTLYLSYPTRSSLLF